jgi:hypothetical protein
MLPGSWLRPWDGARKTVSQAQRFPHCRVFASELGRKVVAVAKAFEAGPNPLGTLQAPRVDELYIKCVDIGSAHLRRSCALQFDGVSALTATSGSALVGPMCPSRPTVTVMPRMPQAR